MLLRILATIAMSVAIPVIGLMVANIVLGGIHAQVAPGDLCPPWQEPSALCERAFWTTVMREIAVMSGVAFAVVIVAYVALARIAGADRSWNAWLFPKLAPAATFAIGVLALIQGAVLTGAVYLIGAHFLGAWAGAAGAVAVGLAALIGGVSVLWTLMRANVEKPTGVLARPQSREQAPELWGFIDELADAIGAERPRNLLVGLDPTFFATAAPVKAPGLRRALHGESLYLSLPLMRLFTLDELRAVVGHELGHFSGADTAYSKRFAPVYRNLAEAIGSLSGEDDRLRALITAPARLTLELMFEMFALNERRISRDRELAADQIGASVATPEALAVSLAKVAVYAPLWGKVRRDNAGRLSLGRFSRNLSKVYADSARYDVSHRAIGEILNNVLAVRISHPTDSHPRIAERFAGVGYEPQRLSIEALTRQGASAAALFQDLEAVEADLTLVEHQMLVAAGLAKPPEDAPEQNRLLNATYILAATMAVADSGVIAREIHVAEAIGVKMFEDFDPVSFREVVEGLADLPDFLKVVELLDGVLKGEHKRMLHLYLGEIASADGETGARERELLERVARIWGLKGLRRLTRRK